MDAVTRRKLSMVSRVADFSAANPSDQASITALTTRLAALVTQAEQLAVQERTGTVSESLARSQRALVRRDMRRSQLRHLARIARMASKAHPELATLFRLPNYGAPNHDFVVAATNMLAAATARKDLLDTLGLGENFVTELTQAMTDFNDATEQAHAGRAGHVGASAELKAVVDDATKVVMVLDGLNRSRFAGEPDLLAAWQSASKTPSRFKHDVTVIPPAPVAGPAGGASKGS
jgi:hypothetical protein